MSALQCSSNGAVATPANQADAAAADAAPETGGADGSGAPRGPLPGELSIVACPGAPAYPVPSSAPSCDTICGAAHCISISLAGSNPAVPECPDDGTGAKGLCLPDPLFASGGKFTSPSCTSSVVNGAAVCTPYCFAGMYKDVLKRDSCAAGEVCAPCINPTNGKPTGACDDRCAPSEAGADGAAVSDTGGDSAAD